MGAMGAMRSVGERRKTVGNARNAKARDPVGSQTADERGFGDRNVRWAELRAAAGNGDWLLWNVSG